MKKAKVKLKKCPFCGRIPKIGSLTGDKINWSIWCKCGIPCIDTGMDTGIETFNTKEEIIAAWNKRKGHK